MSRITEEMRFRQYYVNMHLNMALLKPQEDVILLINCL